MDRSKKMTETESEIMEVLWSAEAPMSASELIDYFAKHHGKSWKASTLATFLSRLGEKGLVDSVRRGRVPYYHPIQTKTAYRQSIAQEVLDFEYVTVDTTFLENAQSMTATLVSVSHADESKFTPEQWSGILEMIDEGMVVWED